MSAIVFWLEENNFSVIPSSAVLTKDQQKNTASKVMWKDAEVRELKKKIQSLEREKKVNVKEKSQELEEGVLQTESLTFNRSSGSENLKEKTLPRIPANRDSFSVMRNGEKLSPTVKKMSKINVRNVEILNAPEQYDKDGEIDDKDDEIVDEAASEDEAGSGAEISNIFPPVTIEFARSVMQWAKFLEKHCAAETKKSNSNRIFNHGNIPDEARTAGPEKTEISPGSSVYIRTGVLDDMKTRIGNQWRKFATELLVEIYGTDLKNRTAKGTRGTRAIDHNVFMAIFDCINHESEKYISLSEFTKLVNTACSNRRRLSKRKGTDNGNIEGPSTASDRAKQSKRA